MKKKLISLLFPGFFAFSSLAQEETKEDLPPKLIPEGPYSALVEPVFEHGKFSPVNLVEAVLEYPDREKYGPSQDSFFGTFQEKLFSEFESERHQPQYYLFRDYKEENLPYKGLFISASGKALISHSDFFRELDRTVRETREAITYKKDIGGLKLSVGPYLSSVENSEDVGLKIDLDSSPWIFYSRVYADRDWRCGISSNLLTSIKLEVREQDGERILASFCSFGW